ncbi:MAG: ribosome maturation factor RimM [Candidatus Marinarcus sp.]|uniref:ribosome maturation factor RimM n=1 Tax=Candidatus Marinarcus sp. TaxID=3100987 RepID=UPI003AFFC42D
MSSSIYIGKLGKTVGLDGSLKIYIESDFPEQFKKGAVFTTNKKSTLRVQSYSASRDIVKFENINSADEAKKLVNQQLFTTLEQTRQSCTLEENQYFWFDLMDCKVMEGDLLLGVVKDIQRLPSSDYFEVVTDIKLQEKELPKLFLIPYIEMYVVEVDIKNKIIYTKDCISILENS